IERLPSKQRVVGSNPTWDTIIKAISGQQSAFSPLARILASFASQASQSTIALSWEKSFRHLRW
ncbi:MAG: hypothetical protein WCC72_10370, partial [Dehalococcoidales bacterium]